MNASDWKAPTQDGQILVSPGIDQLAQSAQENHRRLSDCSILIAGEPLRIWRQRMRQILGHADADQLLICAGHQAELYHPGVWIKLALIDRLSQITNGHALQISVDSDSPKHLLLRHPAGAIEILPASAATAAWSGLLPSPPPSHLHTLQTQIQQITESWNFPSLLPSFVEFLIAQSSSQQNFPAALSHAMQQLDRQLGLSYDLKMTQPIWTAEPYLAFVFHVLSHADEFAAHYNIALAQYRIAERIKNPGRPMPDLQRDSDKVELPFWLDDLHTARRQRLTAAKISGQWRFDVPGAGDAALNSPADLSRFCSARNIRLAPRALTLTMFVRLFVCDQWIHGIGGAQYDQVTNQIIRNFFRIDPPAFGVTTATLYFPLAAIRQRTSLPDIKHAGHRLHHEVLGEKKTHYLQQINTAPRRSIQRAEIFSRMHQALSESDSPALTEWSAQWKQAQQSAGEDRSIFDRELFYALQPENRLSNLLENLS